MADITPFQGKLLYAIFGPKFHNSREILYNVKIELPEKSAVGIVIWDITGWRNVKTGSGPNKITAKVRVSVSGWSRRQLTLHCPEYQIYPLLTSKKKKKQKQFNDFHTQLRKRLSKQTNKHASLPKDEHILLHSTFVTGLWRDPITTPIFQMKKLHLLLYWFLEIFFLLFWFTAQQHGKKFPATPRQEDDDSVPNSATHQLWQIVNNEIIDEKDHEQ